MTGFGLGEAALGAGRLAIELRSLNHRFLEVRVRMPAELSEHAFSVEQSCRRLLQRGRYDVGVRLLGNPLPKQGLDLERGRAVYESLCQLRDELAPGADIPISVLASVPDVMGSGTPADPALSTVALNQALTAAIKNLNTMRSTEGAALKVELLRLLVAARGAHASIAGQTDSVIEAYRRRLRARIARLIDETEASVDPARLEVEVAVLAERSDVVEELSRLESHFAQFEALCDDEAPVGRRLDFLLQEIAREANTIGAKCQDANLSVAVIQLKADVERLREQVQNVE